MRIEQKRMDIAKNQELEFQKLKVKAGKTNPEAFKRLTSPKSAVIGPLKSQEKKFSIREAIESGKRLMHKKNIKSPSLSNSPVRAFYNTESFMRTNTKNNSPSKTSRPYHNEKDLDEIFSRCKQNAMILNRKNRPAQKSMNFVITTTSNINLFPHATTASSPDLDKRNCE